MWQDTKDIRLWMFVLPYFGKMALHKILLTELKKRVLLPFTYQAVIYMWQDTKEIRLWVPVLPNFGKTG
jgi:hypothetical protein